MDLWTRLLLFLAGLMGATGVAAAAAAAHVSGGANLETAAHFLMLNAAALAGVSAIVLQAGGARVLLQLGASAIALGTILFSGDLAARALMEVKLLGGSAPFGGSAMILGWLLVAGGALAFRKA